MSFSGVFNEFCRSQSQECTKYLDKILIFFKWLKRLLNSLTIAM